MPRNDPGQLKHLEGLRVCLALSDGSRIDDCELVAVGGANPGHLWVHANGSDAFVPLTHVADVWEAGRPGRG